MNNKLIGVLFLGIGLVAGWLIWGAVPSSRMTHVMPDGSVMQSGGMDMSTMMAEMNASLAGKTGDDFDKAFIAEMIVHHQGAIDMAKLAKANAAHVEIRNLADAIIRAQTTEIGQMKAWQQAWYPVSPSSSTTTKTVTLSGTYVCLPHLNTSGPQTEECAFGLKTDAGEYYAVNFGASANAMEQFQSGAHIKAEGFVVAKEALSTDQWAKYTMKGIFTITKMIDPAPVAR